MSPSPHLDKLWRADASHVLEAWFRLGLGKFRATWVFILGVVWLFWESNPGFSLWLLDLRLRAEGLAQTLNNHGV